MDSQLAAKVILVDDEEEFIDLMSQRLETRGLKVVAVTSGEKAVAMTNDQSFDVAVMLTGQATVQSGIEAMKHGASDFLEKPVDLNVLMEKIQAAKETRMDALKKKSEDEMKNILKSKSW